MAYLPKGVEYYGFDGSERYIEFAKHRFGDRGEFRSQMVDELAVSNLPKIDVVIATGLVHHLEDDEARILFRTAKKALAKQGRFISIDPCYDDGQSAVAKWFIDRDRGQNVRTAEAYTLLLEREFSNTIGMVKNKRWLPYTHFIAQSN